MVSVETNNKILKLSWMTHILLSKRQTLRLEHESADEIVLSLHKRSPDYVFRTIFELAIQGATDRVSRVLADETVRCMYETAKDSDNRVPLAFLKTWRVTTKEVE